MQPRGPHLSRRVTPVASTPDFRTALATSQLCHAHARAGRPIIRIIQDLRSGHSSLRSHRDLHPPHRAVAGSTPSSPLSDHRRPLPEEGRHIAMAQSSRLPPKSKIELADVVRQFGPQYLAEHGEADDALAQEGTFRRPPPAAPKSWGDGSTRCDDCDDTFWSYHCCRNRRLPQMPWKPGSALARKSVNPSCCHCDYFHTVMTVPEELRGAFCTQPEVDVWPADAGLGRGDQGTFVPKNDISGPCPACCRCSTPGMAAWAITPTCTC